MWSMNNMGKIPESKPIISDPPTQWKKHNKGGHIGLEENDN